MSKTKDIATKEQNLPTDLQIDNDLLAMLPRAESSDFDIPRLTLVQPTSKIEGSAGDIIESDSGDKICGFNQKLEFIPVSFVKDFVISEAESDKFRRNEPKTAQNAHYSVFANRVGTDPDGVAVKRNERINLFLIKASSIDEEFPRLYRMILKPSSFKEAKKFLSEWEIQIRSRLIPFSYVWSVTPKEVRNEKGKFAILEFRKEMSEGKQKQITQAQLKGVVNWVKMIQANQAEVIKDQGHDHSDEETSTAIPF